MPAKARDTGAPKRLRPATPIGRRFDTESALAHLRTADARLGAFMDRHGAFAMQLKDTSSTFAALAEAIVYQQLNGRAAATIFGRFAALYPGQKFPVAADVLATPDEPLRAAGLSRNKILAIRDLAERTVQGTVPDVAALRRMPDDEVVACLTAVRGIGRWTAEMLLMFRLGRPDVLPVDDYGVRKGFSRLAKLDELIKPKALLAEAEPWRPYRSVAAWYCWRVLDV